MPLRLQGPPPGLRGSRLDPQLLRSRALRALRVLGHGPSELSLCLVGDAEIAELNHVWRGRPGPTDVLSFSLLEGDHPGHRGNLLGDVVISVETAARQAAERHRGLDEEVARLLVHGLLHLLGYDHERDEEARRMAATQRRVWREIDT